MEMGGGDHDKKTHAIEVGLVGASYETISIIITAPLHR